MLPARRRSDKDRTQLCTILGSDTAACSVPPAKQYRALLRAEVMCELCVERIYYYYLTKCMWYLTVCWKFQPSSLYFAFPPPMGNCYDCFFKCTDTVCKAVVKIKVG